MTDKSTTTNDQDAKRRALAQKHANRGMTTAKALRNYRIAAWVVGVPLALLFLVAMPMKYFGDNGTPVMIIGIAHGWLYMGFMICAAMLAIHRRWSLVRTILVILAGTIPLVSFWAEHVVHRRVLEGADGW